MSVLAIIRPLDATIGGNFAGGIPSALWSLADQSRRSGLYNEVVLALETSHRVEPESIRLNASAI